MIAPRILLAASLVASGLSLAACAGKPPRSAAPASPVRAVQSDATARASVAITVYNQNFGVVRERRSLALGEGHVELAFKDVAALLEPQTVHLRAVADPNALAVLEQNYRYDLLTPETLLKKSVGKTIRVYRYNEQLGRDEVKAAEVLAVEQGVVLRIDGQVTSDFRGRFAFPEVPPELLSKPTLVWLLESRAAKQDVEVTYLTRGLNWSADYVLVLGADSRTSDLTGWVTLANESGTSYERAQLKLVAGDVQRVQPPQRQDHDMMAEAAPAASAPPQFRQESLFEYHLYSLDRPTTIRDKEQKQVTLLEAHGVPVQKKLRLTGVDGFYRSQIGPVPRSEKVSVFVVLENRAENRLGMPLPKGVVRVYQADQSGAQQFVGEDNIDHTPQGEKLEIRLGNAFDVVAERKQIRWTSLGSCSAETEWHVELRNHKATNESVEVFEPAGGDWQVTRSTHTPRREDQNTVVFDVAVPARGKALLHYVIRSRWCSGS